MTQTKDEADILTEYVDQAGLAVEWPCTTADYAQSVVNYANMLEQDLVDTEKKIDNLNQMLLGMVEQNCQYMIGLYDSGNISTHHIVLEYLADVGLLEKHKSHQNPDGAVYRIKS